MHIHTPSVSLLLKICETVCRGTGRCTLNSSTTKPWSKTPQKRVLGKSIMAFISTASTPKYPAAWVPWAVLPLRGGRIVCLHGRGHYLPTCISARAPTTLATWSKRTCCSHRETAISARWREKGTTDFWICPCGCTVSRENVLPCVGHVWTTKGCENVFRHY